MQDKSTTKSTFLQLLDPITNSKVKEKIKALGVDRYVKKLPTTEFLFLLSYAQLQQFKSLRQISSSIQNEFLQNALDINSFSTSQISRRLRDLPTEIVRSFFDEVRSELVRSLQRKPSNMDEIQIIDSTTISLCLTKYPWAVFRKAKAGVKIHLRICFTDTITIPENLTITPAKKNDRTQMEPLVKVDSDAIQVFDRGYVDYEKFDDYCRDGILFVTRLKENAIIDVIEELPVKPNSFIHRERIVRLGNAGINKMEHPLRCIEILDTQGHTIIIVTNDFNRSVEEIGDIYRHRWQIELFFKWIKQHLQVKHFFGTGQQAVENQIHIILIAYCLLKLLSVRSGFTGTLLEIQRLLQACWFEMFDCFLQKLQRPKRSSRGRRKAENERIFAFVERQVMEDLDLVYDNTYEMAFI